MSEATPNPSPDLWAQLKTENAPDISAAVAAECGQERARCGALVTKEIDAALAAGIPQTSAAFRILERLRAAIVNG